MNMKSRYTFIDHIYSRKVKVIPSPATPRIKLLIFNIYDIKLKIKAAGVSNFTE